jgi:hypothetical protein
MKLRSATFAVAVLSLVAGPAATQDKAKDKQNKLPEPALKVLQNATEFELYSIDFAHPDEKTGFHNMKSMGKTTVKDAETRKKLVTEFAKGMEGELYPAKCFNPRHGIRATHDGKTVDLVICFECAQFHLYEGKDAQPKTLLIGKGPEAAFDKVLKDAGVPKPKN